MKKWLSRGLVLAMIVAMMIPMPVAAKAKSDKGGKVVKTVSTWAYDNTAKKYVPVSKTSYQYDKKGNLTEKKKAYLDSFMGVLPYANWTSVTTYKNKYKGNSLKKSTATDANGTIVGVYNYKKGQLKTSNEVSFLNDSMRMDVAATYQYNKKGYKTLVYGSTAYTNETPFTWAQGYSWTMKKGLPYVVGKTSTSTYKGVTTPNTPQYAICNDKGLVIESGEIVNGVVTPHAQYAYAYKGGKVVTAQSFTVLNGNRATLQQSGLWQFTYTSDKLNKADYAAQINDEVCWIF
jgi:hypothetical protein